MLETVAGAAAKPAVKWMWEKLAQPLADKAQGELQKKWQAFTWQTAAEKYQQKLIELHGYTRMLGSPAPVPLAGIFTDLFILDKPLAFRRFELAQLREDASCLAAHEAQRHNGVELVKQADSQRLFILGKPGAGKTTFLKYMTLQAAQGELTKTPIFISLHEWASTSLSLMDFLVKQFEICGLPDAQAFIAHLLQSGQALVLFDGLDEVKQEAGQRAEIALQLKQFCQQYHQAQCLITCRLAANEYVFEQFSYVEVADFTEAQIAAFVSKWYRDQPAKGEKFLQEFAQEEHRSLRELARAPLLLSLLCLKYDDSMAFSNRRADIYYEALEALLQKWDGSRGIQRDSFYKGLSLKRKQQMFARIAAKTFDKNQYFIEKKVLVKQIEQYLQQLPDDTTEVEGESVLQQIIAQHGIFAERAYGIYSFAHLTFQEYYTAQYIVENEARGAVAGLVKGNITDNRWREVFLLTASLLDNADEFFQVFLRELQLLIRQDDELAKLLHWANDKTQRAVLEKYLPSAVRMIYTSLEMDKPNFLEKLDKHINYVFQRIEVRLLILDDIASRTYEINDNMLIDMTTLTDFREHKMITDPEISLDIMLYLQTKVAIFYLRSSEKTFKHIQNNVGQYIELFKNMIEKANTLGLTSLEQQLIFLHQHKIPKPHDAQKKWATLAKQLLEIMQQQRDIGHQWNLEEKQYELIADYFRANKLLLDCLQLATVSDREGIKNQLFLLDAIE